MLDKLVFFDFITSSFNSNQFINYIRGMSETPGGYVLVNGLKFKILKAKRVQKLPGEVGKLIINKQTFLNLTDATIELLEVQMAGKNKMDGRSFANGNKHLDGTIVK